MQCSTLGNMSLTYRISNVAFLGLLVSLSLFSAEQIVDTNPHAVLEVGTRGILPCRIQRRGYSVEWKRQLSSGSELLVSLDVLFDVGKRDGPGYEAGLFNITDDYSLVIKDVKVQDEGLYICLFSDYQTGKPFENSTRVSVQAFPDEPFPVIQECIGKDVNSGACTLTIYSTSNLTCLVEGYYPDIDLFFLHGSEKMTSTEDEEWHNADGTKNRDITIQISVSDEPYECVASSWPGMFGNRSVTVIVKAIHNGPRATVIVAPVLVVAICLSIAVIFKCYLGNRRGRRSGFMPILMRTPIDGPVSKLELWKLVKKAKESDVEKLRAVLRRLGRLSKTDASKLEEDDDFYERLCEWKRETSSNSNQRKDLYSVCNKEGMSEIIRTMKDYIRSTSYDVHDVSKANIDYILWGIGDPMKIIELLKALALDHETAATASEKGKREVINIARNELQKWRELEFSINPLVILSLKLDDLECETDFFKLPLRQKKKIDVEEMKDICCQIFEHHFQSLLKAIRDHLGDMAYQIKRFVEENNASLFNTVQMLEDWERDEECSYYEKRNQLQKAAKAAVQRNDTVDKWPPDDELRVIASFLSPESMEQLCSKLHIKSPPEEASHDHDDQEKLFQVLTEWRDNHASSKDLMEKHNELFNALKEDDRGGLVPRVKGPLVYKAELIDLAFHLFAQDLLPFTEALGIPSAKLVAYRPTFHPLHMTQGTIGLVCKLSESGERSHLLKLLKEIPYPNVFASAMLALEISFGEVCAISVGSRNSQEREGMQPPSNESTPLPPGDHDSSMGTTEKKLNLAPAKSMHTDARFDEGIQPQSENEVFSEIMTLLTSANQVEDHNQPSTESSAFLQNFKVWRERPRLIPLNFRLALANCLRREDNFDQIYKFLQGILSEEHRRVMDQDVTSSNTVSPIPNLSGMGKRSFDDMLKIVAKNIVHNSAIDDLGGALGFDAEEIHLYIAMNHRYQNITNDGTLQILRDWVKRQTESTMYLALKRALEESGNIRLADDLFGKGKRKEGIIPFTFIYNILQNMDFDQRFVLRGLIADAPFHPVSDELEYTSTTKEESFELTETVSTHVFVWTKEWIKEMIQAKGETTEIDEKHKKFNDKLVDHGFIDLAREIMISERQLIDTQCAT